MALHGGGQPQPPPPQIARKRRRQAVEIVAARFAQRKGAPVAAEPGEAVLAVVRVQGLGEVAEPEVPAGPDIPGQTQPCALTDGVARVDDRHRRVVDRPRDDLAVGDQPDTEAVAKDGRIQNQIDRAARAGALGCVDAGEDLGAPGRQIGRRRHQFENTADRPCAIQRALRPAQQLGMCDVHQPKVRVRGVIGQSGLVEILADHGLCLSRQGAVGQAAHEKLVSARPQIGDRQTGDAGRKVRGVAPRRLIEDGAVDRGQGIGRVGEGDVAPGRRDDDLVQHLGSRIAGSRRPGDSAGAGDHGSRRPGGTLDHIGPAVDPPPGAAGSGEQSRQGGFGFEPSPQCA